MLTIIWTLKIISIPVILIGAFTAVVLIGIPIIALAIDMNDWANKLEKSYYKYE